MVDQKKTIEELVKDHKFFLKLFSSRQKVLSRLNFSVEWLAVPRLAIHMARPESLLDGVEEFANE